MRRDVATVEYVGRYDEETWCSFMEQLKDWRKNTRLLTTNRLAWAWTSAVEGLKHVWDCFLAIFFHFPLLSVSIFSLISGTCQRKNVIMVTPIGYLNLSLWLHLLGICISSTILYGVNHSHQWSKLQICKWKFSYKF